MPVAISRYALSYYIVGNAFMYSTGIFVIGSDEGFAHTEQFRKYASNTSSVSSSLGSVPSFISHP